MDEQTQQQAEALGKRIALLLASVPLPQEVKNGMAAAVPTMTPEQLERFVVLLEKELPDGADLAMDRFKADMEMAQNALSQKEEEITQDTHRALDELEKDIK